MSRLLLAPAAFGALVGGAFLLLPLREKVTPQAFAGDEQFVTVGGYAMHYTDEGPRDGPVVVLLHGFAAWAFTWREQRRALVAAGYRVITIDQLGYGASARPEEPVYTTRTQAELTLGVLDALGVERADFVGHSFGGRVVMQIALLVPGRVRSLVAICPEAFATERPPIGSLVATPLLGTALAFYTLAPNLVRTGLRQLSGSGAWLTDAVVAGYAAPLRVRGTIAAQVWQARSPKDGAPPIVPRHLAEIHQPTLLIWGGSDPVFPSSDGDKLAEIMPHTTLRVFAGAGHLPHEEAQAGVTAAILAFLEEQHND